MMQYNEYKDSGIDWLGEIPNSWGKVRLKDLGFLYGGLSGKSGDDFGQDGNENNKCFIPYTNILNNSIINPSQMGVVVIFEDEEQNQVKANDMFFLMSSEDYEGLGKSALLKEDLKETYLNSFCKGYRITSKNVFPEFLNYALNAFKYKIILQNEGKGFTRMNLKTEKISGYRLFLPPLTEQTAIANYLDEKTAQIDSRIALLNRKADLYRELRRSLINTTVTQGLNPKAPTKPSNIDWLGEIPQHWETARLKEHYQNAKGLNITKADLIEKGIPVISYGQIHSESNTGTKIEDELYRYVSESYLVDNSSSLVRKEDFIFADTSEDLEGCGNCVFVDKEDTIFAGYHTIIMSPKTKETFGKYIAYLFKSDKWRSQLRSKVSRVKVYSITLKILTFSTILLPPLKEQIAIANYLDEKTTQIDNIISQINQQTKQLAELRRSLIDNVVTGKIKITED